MTKQEELAADIIDEVISAIHDVYPELKVKAEFLEECEDASLLYGESYYNLESSVANTIKDWQENNAVYFLMNGIGSEDE